MYQAIDVAEYILSYYKSKDKYIPSNFKLQKILYYLQAEFLVAIGKPCFSDEIEAWNFGPIIKKVYDKYKIYGSASIPVFGLSEKRVEKIYKRDCTIINEVLDTLEPYSSVDLTKISQGQKPWKDAYLRKKLGGKGIITNESLINYFKED